MGFGKTAAAFLTIAATMLAKDCGSIPQRPVTVCMNPGANAAVVFRAEGAASQILATAGVRLNWQSDPGSCTEPAFGIVIRLMLNTPLDEHPGAMAYALPYSRTTIVVFYDRVQAAGVPLLLAHVLAHEITHVLEGLAVHSATGIMKAKWTSKDYVEMRRRALQFTDEDVILIRHGLDSLERRK